MRTVLIAFLLLLGSCRTTGGKIQPNGSGMEKASAQTGSGPKALVYKTAGDYDRLVPVGLSDDKSGIVSYPHPTDVRIGDQYPTPTKLAEGYLLDNRGIGKNVAFLKLAYEDYGKLESTPSLKELYGLIIDKSPLVELWDCGYKDSSGDLKGKLNKIIEDGKLADACTALK
ncbi:MAG: hypothetical protein JWO30_2521 [Fibrobacteres bacterium]|nr:hypothetical protein [Fibrobacterota bacterium]